MTDGDDIYTQFKWSVDSLSQPDRELLHQSIWLGRMMSRISSPSTAGDAIVSETMLQTLMLHGWIREAKTSFNCSGSPREVRKRVHTAIADGADRADITKALNTHLDHLHRSFIVVKADPIAISLQHADYDVQTATFGCNWRYSTTCYVHGILTITIDDLVKNGPGVEAGIEAAMEQNGIVLPDGPQALGRAAPGATIVGTEVPGEK